jgi:hypothetical protein
MTRADIVVTGSLIQRPNNTAVSPIVTVGAIDQGQPARPTLQDALNQFPSFTTGGNSATGGQGTGGRASINLHGLGTNRNLVCSTGGACRPRTSTAMSTSTSCPKRSSRRRRHHRRRFGGLRFGRHVGRGQFQDRALARRHQDRSDELDQRARRRLPFNGSLAFGTHFAGDRGHASPRSATPSRIRSMAARVLLPRQDAHRRSSATARSCRARPTRRAPRSCKGCSPRYGVNGDASIRCSTSASTTTAPCSSRPGR